VRRWCHRYVKPNSGAAGALGGYDPIRVRQFAREHGGALVEKWQLFGAALPFSAAAE